MMSNDFQVANRRSRPLADNFAAYQELRASGGHLLAGGDQGGNTAVQARRHVLQASQPRSTNEPAVLPVDCDGVQFNSQASGGELSPCTIVSAERVADKQAPDFDPLRLN